MQRKHFLIVTIILLFISLSLTSIALYQKFIVKLDITLEKERKNAMQEKKKTLKLVNAYNDLIGTYSCNYENCSYASYTTDDENYAFEYPLSTPGSYDKVINNRYAFIEDYAKKNDKKILLYDINAQKIIASFQNFKTYYIDLENNRFIVQKANKSWNIISLENEYEVLCKTDFDYIGVKDEIDSLNKNLIADRFVAKKNNKWMIIDESGQNISIPFDKMITSYNGLYLSIMDNDKNYVLYDYEGKIIDNNYYDYINFISKYVIFVQNNYLNIKDIEENKTIVSNVPLLITEYKYQNSFEINIENNKLEVKVKKDQNTYDKTYSYNLS